MLINKNQSKDLLLAFFKTLLLIVGLDILLTSLFTIIKGEFKRNNFESEINLNIKKLTDDQNIQIDIDIY